MKMMQHKYAMFSKIEVELKQLEDTNKPPTRPCKSYFFKVYKLTSY